MHVHSHTLLQPLLRPPLSQIYTSVCLSDYTKSCCFYLQHLVQVHECSFLLRLQLLVASLHRFRRRVNTYTDRDRAGERKRETARQRKSEPKKLTMSSNTRHDVVHLILSLGRLHTHTQTQTYSHAHIPAASCVVCAASSSEAPSAAITLKFVRVPASSSSTYTCPCTTVRVRVC